MQEVGCSIKKRTPCLGEDLKLSDLRFISLRSCRIIVPSDYKSEGLESAPVFAHSLGYADEVHGTITQITVLRTLYYSLVINFVLSLYKEFLV